MMKRKFVLAAAIAGLGIVVLGLSACETTPRDESGTHVMGGRAQSGTMPDAMMPDH